MNQKMRLLALFMLLVFQAACSLLAPTPMPPSGWSGNVRDLFVDESAFPFEWVARELGSDDPLANHVDRGFNFIGNPPLPGTVTQSIWRAYTIADAEEKYAELRQSQFQPRLEPEEMVAPWLPPEEIDFQSIAADESYLACGWEEWASCHYLARYKNYVTYLNLDLQAQLGTLESHGLTYDEIEAVLKAADAQFEATLNRLSGK